MPTADLITDFLGNEMSPERERQFLLSVAASDALRLELKSHLMVDRILVDRVQSARVNESVRSTIFAAAGVATGHVAPESPTSQAVGRAPAPRASFFSRLGGRVTLVAAACAFFGAGYFAGSGPDPLRATNAGPSSASDVKGLGPVTAPGGVADTRNGATPRVVTEQPNAGLAGEPTTRARSSSGTVAIAPRSANGATNAGSALNAPPNATPTSTTDPAQEPRTPRRPIRSAKAPAGAHVVIEKPSDETRKRYENTNPLQDGGPTVR